MRTTATMPEPGEKISHRQTFALREVLDKFGELLDSKRLHCCCAKQALAD